MKDEVDEALDQMFNLGLASRNPDGTIRLSEGARQALQELIALYPEKFSELFPDRLN